MAVTVGVERGVELASPETEQWVKDKFEAWRLTWEAGGAACYTGGTDRGGGEVGVGRIGNRPLRIHEGKGKDERNSPHRFACKGEAGPGYQFS